MARKAQIRDKQKRRERERQDMRVSIDGPSAVRLRPTHHHAVRVRVLVVPQLRAHRKAVQAQVKIAAFRAALFRRVGKRGR